MSIDAILVPDWVLEMGRPLGPSEHPLRQVIADVLDEMEEGHRRALEMWAWEGLTFREIAEELELAGRQSGQARVQAALRVFKEKMEERIETATQRRDSNGDRERELRGPEDGDGLEAGDGHVARRRDGRSPVDAGDRRGDRRRPPRLHHRNTQRNERSGG